MTVPGVVPPVGLAASQEALEDDAVYASGEPVLATVNACDEGREPPF